MEDNRIFYAGVDVGNYDTKSPNTAFLSGYDVSDYPPLGGPDSYIKYNGKYYVLSLSDRFPYIKDKTVDERLGIVTLISIAKEMEYIFTKRFANTEHASQHVLQSIKDVETVHLGVGLPPSHLATLKDKTIEYYKKFFGNGVTYEYNDRTYSFKLGKIFVYPQNFAAVVAENPSSESIISMANDFTTIDIGGYTLDKVTIVNRKVDPKKCDSMSRGLASLCSEMTTAARREKGVSLSDTIIVNILQGKKTFAGEEIEQYVRDFARKWTYETLDLVAQSGVDFVLTPVIFMGGTSLLLEKYIRSYGKIKTIDFIRSANANAEAYRKLAKNMVESRK